MNKQTKIPTNMDAKVVNIECNMLKYIKTNISTNEAPNQLQPILDSMFPPK